MIIDGKAIAAQVKASLQGSDAKLAVIMVGDDPASSVYVRSKERACAGVGIRSCSRRLPATASTKEVIASIAELSAWADGILVQLPLPEHIDEKKVLGAIPPEKDVDCFHPYNIGKLLTGEAGLRPCTPAGILHLLGDVSGKHCVIIGRSNIVGKPLALMLLHANATVTVCHSKTKDLASYTRQADVLISAVGNGGVRMQTWLSRGRSLSMSELTGTRTVSSVGTLLLRRSRQRRQRLLRYPAAWAR